MRILILLLLITHISYSQKIDTIINNSVYTSYYNYSFKSPIFVTQVLYKGGGDCNRKNMRFKSHIKPSNTNSDFYKSGYDIGHLANFEDYAFDCFKAELTFRFYNSLPQSPNLNRGIWKRYEHIIRKISQNEKLLIISGGYLYKKKGKIYVPDYCFKIVYSLDKKVIVYALLFTNDDNAKVSIETISTLEKKLGYNLRKLIN